MNKSLEGSLKKCALEHDFMSVLLDSINFSQSICCLCVVIRMQNCKGQKSA